MDPFELFKQNIPDSKYTKEQWFEVSFKKELTKPFIDLYHKKLFQPVIVFRSYDSKNKTIHLPEFICFMLQKCNIFDKLNLYRYKTFRIPKIFYTERLKFKNYTIYYNKEKIQVVINPEVLSIILLKLRKEIKIFKAERLFICSWKVKASAPKEYYYELKLADSPKVIKFPN